MIESFRIALNNRKSEASLIFFFFLFFFLRQSATEVQWKGCTPFVIDGTVILADRLIQFHAAPFARSEFREAVISEYAGFAALARRHYHPVTYPQLALLCRGRQTCRRCICIHSFQRCAIIITYHSHRLRNHEWGWVYSIKITQRLFLLDDEARFVPKFLYIWRSNYIFLFPLPSSIKAKSTFIFL